MAEEKSLFEKLGAWFRNSITLKFFIIGILILILLIPGAMVQDLIRERQASRDHAVEEVASKWGSPQTIGGPVISIPYKRWVKNADGKQEESRGYVHFLPADLEINGKLEPEKRHRGIYIVMLYRNRLDVKGSFDPLAFSKLNVALGDLMLEKATISIGLSDLKGVNKNIEMHWNDTVMEMESGMPVHDVFASGVSAPVHISNTSKGYKFSFQLDVNGSESVQFCPFGKITRVHLESPWGSPSFMGSFLPQKKLVNNSGFIADWQVLHLNRNYPQQGEDNFIPEIQNKRMDEDGQTIAADRNASFGVRLYLPVDDYQQTNRSAKYSSMFILLTFLCFFFVEVLNGKRIHPIQYLLVGFAIVLFYVLLLSISEHLSFPVAYWLSCGLITSLIVYYSWNMLKNTRLTTVVGVVFLILYGFFYSLLQLEDYALLAGSIGLLVILSTVMYMTRKVDWYSPVKSS